MHIGTTFRVDSWIGIWGAKHHHQMVASCTNYKEMLISDRYGTQVSNLH